ncbi:PREDICTED: calcium and integrin-binding protein 1-like [Wasmannia auropunctata]|uniref:calcium and integrin-binding protein 1-like n=1 Tax=Wasmannia auropunctata TaxID=64793 RepID=UPI0005EF1C39|nr:PREDICTED: calcium and integrin-binding protein 1-like [Wasmannia auropunctata]
MGNTGSNENAISEKALDEYVELTYLSKSEIRQIYKLLDDLEPGVLKQNLHYRFSMEQINKILPQIRYNPLRDAIYRVFSSKRDGRLSFEDTLDLCSAFSANCPRGVRAARAFEIFDFDGDNQVSLDDLIETVRRLAGTDEHGQARIDRQCAEDVARMIMQEMNLSGTGDITPQEFIYVLSKMPDFAHTFQFNII